LLGFVVVLLAIAAVLFGINLLCKSFRPKNGFAGEWAADLLGRLAWRVPLLLAVGLVLILGLLYPIAATATRTNWFHNPAIIPASQQTGPEKDTYTQRTLDATAYLGNKPQFADDYAMIQWINKNLKDRGVLVERIGDGAYQPASRFATNTGLPTLLGWEHHELQWRGWDKPVEEQDIEKWGDELTRRQTNKNKLPEMVHLTGLLREHVDRIYKAATYDEIKDLLEKHHVKYIVVGSLEREAYAETPQGLAKFDQPPFEKVHQIGQTTLYRVPNP
jgi:uncharacterized membrane protein